MPRLYRVARSARVTSGPCGFLENAKVIGTADGDQDRRDGGLGETTAELVEVFRDLGSRGVDILRSGQYLRPSKDHLPMSRFYTPEELTI